MIAGDNKGCIIFLSTKTKKITSHFSIVPRPDAEISIEEIHVLPHNLNKGSQYDEKVYLSITYQQINNE
jgi:hypothetical protein